MTALCQNVFDWLVRTTWQAGALVLLILVVQWVFRKQLAPRWRYALWSLVMLKLMLPCGPQSSLSVFNLARVKPWGGEPKAVAETSDKTQTGQGLTTEFDARNRHLPGSIAQYSFSDPVREFIVIIWLSGTLLLAVRLVFQTATFSRQIRGAEPVLDPEAITSFEACKEMLGVRRPVGLVQTRAINSPAVFGYFRPKLLLPAGVVGTFSQRELRHVFLHELGHVKRHDMFFLWVASALRLLHWMNPLLWIGFKKMALDRELACDDLALTYAPEGERQAYGNTILRILQGCTKRVAGASLVGILEDKSQVIQRISMIAKFEKRPRWSMVGVLMVICLGLITLTEARSQPPEQKAALAKDDASVEASQATEDRQARPPGTTPLDFDFGTGTTLNQLSQAQARLGQLQTDLEQLRQSYTDIHPKVLQLRQEIQQVQARKAELEARFQSEQNKAKAQEAFRRRYGLPPSDAVAMTPNPTNLQGPALGDERSLGRYGFDTKYVARPAGSATNSDSQARAQARAAFLRRYGLVDRSEPPNKDSGPQASSESRTRLSDLNLPLRIYIDANGDLRFGTHEKPVTIEEVKSRLSEERKRNPNVRLSILADKTAPFGQIIKVMDAAKEGKISGVDASVKEAEKD